MCAAHINSDGLITAIGSHRASQSQLYIKRFSNYTLLTHHTDRVALINAENCALYPSGWQRMSVIMMA